jgi:uncharacterized protein
MTPDKSLRPTPMTFTLPPRPHLKHSTATIIQVKVKPNSRIRAFEQAQGGTWLARLTSAPIDGKANAELIALVAEHYQCPKSAVSIKSGASGRVKLVRIARSTSAFGPRRTLCR